MRVQNINNNNHKQNFGAIVISGPISDAEKYYLSLQCKLLGHRLEGGIKKGVGDVLVVNSTKHKTKSEELIVGLIKRAAFDNNDKVLVETTYKKAANKYTSAYEKKHPQGFQIEEPVEEPVNNVFKRPREIV